MSFFTKKRKEKEKNEKPRTQFYIRAYFNTIKQLNEFLFLLFLHTIFVKRMKNLGLSSTYVPILIL